MVENKWFGIFIPVILLMTIITPIAHADYININIDVSGIINAVTSGTNQQTQTSNNNTSTLNNSLMGIPQALFGVFTTSAKNSITQINTQLLSLTQELLSANPDPELMYGWWQAITLIISSFYVLIFLYIGFNFLINSHSVVKREQNKEHLKNAIIMIIGVNISFYLYKLILELSTGITSSNYVKQGLFGEIAKTFYKENLKYHCDSYDKFDPNDIMNINVENNYSKNVLIIRIREKSKQRDLNNLLNLSLIYTLNYGINFEVINRLVKSFLMYPLQSN